jgi:hypothetical protein
MKELLLVLFMLLLFVVVWWFFYTRKSGCNDKDDCSGNGKASGTAGNCSCKCKDGFTGAKCGGITPPKPSSCNDKDDCSGNGKASGTAGNCICECKDGFTGAKCKDLKCTAEQIYTSFGPDPSQCVEARDVIADQPTCLTDLMTDVIGGKKFDDCRYFSQDPETLRDAGLTDEQISNYLAENSEKDIKRETCMHDKPDYFKKLLDICGLTEQPEDSGPADDDIMVGHGNPISKQCPSDGSASQWSECQHMDIYNEFQNCSDKSSSVCKKNIETLTTGRCTTSVITPTQVCKMKLGNQIHSDGYAVIPYPCIGQCESTITDASCLANDPSHYEYDHGDNIANDTWLNCLEHPAYGSVLTPKCDTACRSSSGSMLECQSCIDKKLGGMNPFTDNCVMKENTPANCKVSGYPLIKSHGEVIRKGDWDYQLVPTNCSESC